jgi:hypothetical protein
VSDTESELPAADENESGLDLEAMDEIQPGAWMAPGQQVVVSDRLVLGRRFAHRITQHELVAGWLEVVPDFAPLAAFNRHYLTPDGQAIDVVEPGAEEQTHDHPVALALRGPDGWLDGANTAALATLALDGNTLTLTWEPDPGAAADPAALTSTFLRLGNGQPVPLLDLVLHLLIDDPSLGTGDTIVPVRDQLVAAGLVVDGITVRFAERGAAGRASGPAGVPGLGLESAVAAEHLLGAMVAVVQDTPVDLNLVVPALADPVAVGAMAEQVVGGELVQPEQLELLVEGIASATTLTGAAAGGLAFLRSRLAEWRGDSPAQEQALDEALSAGHSAAALVDAAGFAADRGDARGALAQLRTAGIPADDPDAVLLARYTATGPKMVGRNDACWCGSGRKHKQCCLPLNGWDVDARAGWLHAKAIAFLQRPPQRSTLLGVATAHAGVASTDEAPARVIAAACDTTVTELCLVEGGVLARYLAVRGDLLPDDERELGATWAGTAHALWEVTGPTQLTKVGEPAVTRALDAESAAKVAVGSTVLAAVYDGPLALPGPALPVQGGAVDALTEALASGDASTIAAVVGREFGWTAAPDLGSDADRAPDALSTSS